jgi:hypothetical protein
VDALSLFAVLRREDAVSAVETLDRAFAARGRWFSTKHQAFAMASIKVPSL